MSAAEYTLERASVVAPRFVLSALFESFCRTFVAVYAIDGIVLSFLNVALSVLFAIAYLHVRWCISSFKTPPAVYPFRCPLQAFKGLCPFRERKPTADDDFVVRGENPSRGAIELTTPPPQRMPTPSAPAHHLTPHMSAPDPAPLPPLSSPEPQPSPPILHEGSPRHPRPLPPPPLVHVRVAEPIDSLQVVRNPVRIAQGGPSSRFALAMMHVSVMREILSGDS